MENVKRILVVIRLMQNTWDALRHGVSLAKQFGAELCVMRIYSDPVNMEAVNAPGLFLGYKDYLSIHHQYKENLDMAIHEVIGDDFPVREFVTDKDPSDEIIRIVAEEKIDLIVALAHEEGRLEHFLFGGVHDDIIRKLPCSLLLIKHEPKQD